MMTLLALHTFTNICKKKIGTQVDRATDTFVETMDNVNTTLSYINNYYNSKSSDDSPLHMVDPRKDAYLYFAEREWRGGEHIPGVS